MDLYIIRHGEPDVTLEDLSDPPLTALGHRQAAATAKVLARTHFDAVYASPQRRAQQTAEPLVAGRELQAVTEERIAEFDYELGSYVTSATFEGMTRAEAMAKLMAYQGPPFQARVRAGFDDIIANHPGETVAAVCHGGVVNVMVREVLGADESVGPHHASITRITASRSGIRSLTTFNEHHWLLNL